jgi:preprotein translocase subunit Sec61beta
MGARLVRLQPWRLVYIALVLAVILIIIWLLKRVFRAF